MVKSLKLSVLVLLLCCLSACGFHLRDNVILSQEMPTLYLSSATPYGQFEQALTNMLTQANVTLVDDADTSPFMLRIEMHQLTQVFQSISVNTQTRSYTLTYRVNYSLVYKGNVILPTQYIALSQTYISSASQISNSADAEFRNTIRDLHQTAVQQILNRLSSDDVQRLIAAAKKPPIKKHETKTKPT